MTAQPFDLAAALSAPPPPTTPRRAPAAVKPGDTPASYTWDGEKGAVCTPTLPTRPKTWDEYLIDAGLNPDEVTVDEPVEVRGWDANTGAGGTTRMRYYKLRVRLRRPGPSIDELVKLAGRRKSPAKPRATHTPGATFSVDLGDLQLGKIDGDGVEGTVTRTIDGLDRAAAQLKALRRAGHDLGTVKIGWLGDCTEGFVSQGGTNAWRTTLTQTEQIRLLRRLMFRAVDTFAPLTDSLIQLAVPGNHDQAVRLGGKGITRYDDSFDVDALAAVADALAMNPSAYGHVVTHTPERDELTVTIETAGTIVAHAHGHQFAGGVKKAFTWWQGQSFGDQAAGRADVLYAGHLHHLHVEQSGTRTFIQVPALESESTWWKHRTGQTGAPGVLTSVLSGGKVSHLHVC